MTGHTEPVDPSIHGVSFYAEMGGDFIYRKPSIIHGGSSSGRDSLFEIFFAYWIAMASVGHR